MPSRRRLDIEKKKIDQVASSPDNFVEKQLEEHCTFEMNSV